MGLGVRHPERPAEDVADLVVQSRPGRGERHPRLIGGEGEFERGGRAQRGMVDRRLRCRGPQCAEPPTECRQCGRRRRGVDRVGPGRPERVDAVGDAVERRGDEQFRRGVGDERGVVDDGFRQHCGIDPGHLLPRVRQSPHVGGLGSRERRRDRDERHPVGQRDRLADSGRRSAADADDEVGTARGRQGPRGFSGVERNVLDHLGECRGGGEVGEDAGRPDLRGFGAHEQHPVRSDPRDLRGEQLSPVAGAEVDALGGTRVAEAGGGQGLGRRRGHGFLLGVGRGRRALGTVRAVRDRGEVARWTRRPLRMGGSRWSGQWSVGG